MLYYEKEKLKRKSLEQSIESERHIYRKHKLFSFEKMLSMIYEEDKKTND